MPRRDIRPPIARHSPGTVDARQPNTLEFTLRIYLPAAIFQPLLVSNIGCHMDARTPEDSSSYSDLRHLAVLTAAWMLMAALIDPTGDFPLNDDWVYALSVKSILEAGRFDLFDWALATALPQAYWGALFCSFSGFSFTALRVSTLVLGLGGVLATYALMRELSVTPRMALLGAVTVAVNPLYYSLSNSFMTDVPFYFFSVASISMLARGFRGHETIWFSLGVLLSLAAILTRQLGFVIPVGFAAAYLWTRPASLRTLIIALMPLLIGVVLFLALHQWLSMNGRADLYAPSTLHGIYWKVMRDPTAFVGDVAWRLFIVLAYTGLFVLPSALVTFSADQLRMTPEARIRVVLRTLILIALLSVVVLLKQKQMPFGYNVLSSFGIGPLTLRDTYILKQNVPPHPLWLTHAWTAVTCLAILGTALLLGRAWDVTVTTFQKRRAHGRGGLRATPVFLGTTVGTYIALITVATSALFDRYILFCIPFGLVASSVRSSVFDSQGVNSGARRSAWALAALYALFSIAAMHDYMAWNSKRWEALGWLTENNGISPTVIDGGFEFNGWNLHKPGGPASKDGKSWWWVDDDKYIVASGPIDGYEELASFPFWRWLQNVRSRVVVLKREGA